MSTIIPLICRLSSFVLNTSRPGLRCENNALCDLYQFADEAWLDLRRLDLVAPIMLERLDIMKNKGCDAVEWDNADLPVHTVSLTG